MGNTGAAARGTGRVNNSTIQQREKITVADLQWLEKQFDALFNGKGNLIYKARTTGHLDARILRSTMEQGSALIDAALRHMCKHCELWMDEHNAETIAEKTLQADHEFESAV